VTTAPKKQPIPFGKYLLLDRVNIGGMAEVWRAKAFGVGGFERLLAIKKILPNIAEDEEFITMFIDEAKISIQLNHGNIAKIEDLANIAGSYVIAMEYISGKDLRAVFDRCRKRGEPAPIPLTCYIVAQCCEGLDYAHRAKDKSGRDMNIVHRDVSPQNALISYDGEVKVIDFGIAKAAGKAAKTQAGILKGKFGYMSPEQIRGLPLDRRSDVFAVGVCLYEMLTGERLFVGDSDFSVLEKVRKVEVLPPSHFNRKISEALERIVMKALAKDVDDRYQYASELAEDLRAYMYTTGSPFSRKDLSAFMKATFAEDFDAERARLNSYAEIQAPEGMLVSAEQGYGVGPLPSAQAFGPSPSAVTSSPTQAPVHHASVLQLTPASGGLPPIVRPLPPTLSPASLSPLPLVGAGGPKLTAAAPMLGNDHDAHQATVMATPFGRDETKASPHRPPSELNADAAETGPRSPPDGGWDGGETPPPPQRATGPLPIASTPQRPPRNAPVRLEPQAAPGASSQPVPLSTLTPTLEPPPRNTALIIVLAGIVALLLMGLVAAVLLKPPATGILVVDVPAEARGLAQVSINGEAVTEKDGSPIKDWPLVRQVKVGKAVVRLSAPGYVPLVDTVEVTESEPAALQKELKKAGN
jgi:eukaryotic-like serine/threonine-protein kinase